MEAIDRWEQEENFDEYGRCIINQDLICAKCGLCNIDEYEI